MSAGLDALVTEDRAFLPRLRTRNMESLGICQSVALRASMSHRIHHPCVSHPSLCRRILCPCNRGGGVLSRRTGLGPLATLVAETFRPGYVRRMAALRRGDPAGAPHEILDPRDLKYCRNRCACDWDPADDPFRWRGRLPLARWGLAELQLMGWPLLALTILWP